MKANVVAFQSPIPKIYDELPPPCEDLDDVLEILFTGPSKPTIQRVLSKQSSRGYKCV